MPKKASKPKKALKGSAKPVEDVTESQIVFEDEPQQHALHVPPLSYSANYQAPFHIPPYRSLHGWGRREFPPRIHH